jgi:predicted enzyme related to lactoylglutathione lyase
VLTANQTTTRSFQMRFYSTKIVALSLVLAAACAGSRPPAAAPASPAPAAAGAPHAGLQIKLTTIYVDDQDKALRFYTEVLGFVAKDDETNGPYRWLTVAAPGDEDGTALLLALNNDPAAKAFQEAQFKQSQPAIMFYTDDVKADYERIKAAGAEFTMPPTEVMAGSVIATFKDTCGNLVQITQLAY